MQSGSKDAEFPDFVNGMFLRIENGLRDYLHSGENRGQLLFLYSRVSSEDFPQNLSKSSLVKQKSGKLSSQT